MNSYKKNFLYVITTFLVCFLIFGIKNGNMLIDFSRESYIPYKMSEGGVLYKDIFVVYGIFGYIINSLIYKISTNFNLLIALSSIISFAITYLFSLISKQFIKNTILNMLLITGFVSLSIFSCSTFSFLIPYSYSTLWAVLGGYLALFLLLRNNFRYTYLSLGIILANRIEFFIPLLFVTAMYQFIKTKKIKKEIFLVLVVPIVNILYIVLNKISYTDIVNNYNLILKMVKTDSIIYLYKSLGTFFEQKNFLINLGIISVISLFVYILKIIKNKFIFIPYILFTVFIVIINPNEILNLIIVPIIIYLLFNFKKLKQKELLLLSYSIILCSKSIFKLGTISYANFGFFLLILFSIIVLKKIFKKDKKNVPIILITIYIICCNLVNGYYLFTNKKYKVKTSAGTLYLRKYEKELFLQLNAFINNNFNKNDSFIVIPEGEIFNLIFKKPHSFYNSTFTPLDFETFGENKIIESINNLSPTYIILFPRNTSDYGKPTICFNYGIDFCTFIMDNYQRKGILKSDFKALIFKKRQ